MNVRSCRPCLSGLFRSPDERTFRSGVVPDVRQPVSISQLAPQNFVALGRRRAGSGRRSRGRGVGRRAPPMPDGRAGLTTTGSDDQAAPGTCGSRSRATRSGRPRRGTRPRTRHGRRSRTPAAPVATHQAPVALRRELRRPGASGSSLEAGAWRGPGACPSRRRRSAAGAVATRPARPQCLGAVSGSGVRVFSPAGAIRMLYETSVEDLHADHERWIAQGLMTRAQAARIEARERRRSRQETRRDAHGGASGPAEPSAQTA